MSLLLALILLSGCYTLYEVVPELEPVKSYKDFPLTSQGYWSFVAYCQRQWVWEKDKDEELCQSPFVSQSLFRGDCDDFAAMIAYFTEEWWSYDSRIYWIRIRGGTGTHMVAAVYVEYETISWYYNKNGCQANRMYYYSDAYSYRRYYLPVDQSPCLWYRAADCETIAVYEWDEIVGTKRSM